MINTKRQVSCGWFGCLGTAILVMVLGSAAPAQELAGEVRMTLEPLPLTTGSGAQLQADLGRIRVPENRSRPDGARIELAFVRLKRHEMSGTVAHVFLAGGPGASGIELIQDIARNGGEPFLDWLGADVIGIDQRGTGLSVPNLSSDVLYDLPLDVPGTRRQYMSIVTAKCRQVANEFQQRGIDLSAYNTRESADDVEAVRAALGYQKIVLWGRSYGSHLAMATLRRHESRVERVILCSPEGPDHTFKLPSSTEDALERLAEMVRRDPKMNEAVPDLLALMRQVLDRLDAAPVKVQTTHPLTRRPVTVGIGRFDVQFLTAQALGNQAQMRALPRAYVKMSRGQFDEMARLLAVVRSRAGVGSAMKFVMDCSSGASEARLKRIRDEAGQCLLGDAVNLPYPDITPAWGNPDLGPAFREPVRSVAPVLMICGDLDARTPPQNARELMQTLPNAQLLLVENGGHDLNMFGTPAIREVIGTFLAGRPQATQRVRLPEIGFVPINE